MKKSNQSGFAAIEAVLILVVVAILGFTGWFVWHAKQNADKSLNAANSSEQASIKAKKKAADSKPEPGDETKDWLLFKAPSGAWTMKLADGWILNASEGSDGLGTLDNDHVKPLPGTPAKLTHEGGKDGETGLFINYATQNLEQVYTPGTKQPPLKTNDGLDVEKYYYIVSGESGGVGPQPGDMEYVYVIKKGSNRAITVDYSFQPSQADYHETVEKAVKTAHFN
jgi:hypothetical protein